MNLFPETFFNILIIVSLVWTTLAGLTLLVLILADFKNKKIW